MDWKVIYGALRDEIESFGKDFLASHPDDQAFLEKAFADAAKLGAQYALTTALGTEAERLKIYYELKLVKQTIETQLSAMALDAAMEAKRRIWERSLTVLGTLIRLLPTFVEAMKKD